MVSRNFLAKAASLLLGAYLVSLLVDNMAMDLRTWLQTRLESLYVPLAGYYAVHYLVFQLTLIMLVYLVLHGSKLSRKEEAAYVLVITLGKLLGRIEFGTAASLPQIAFSILISTQLSMSAVVIGYRFLSSTTVLRVIRWDDLSLETYSALAIIFWFALMPGIDMLGNEAYSNLLRIAMAFSLLGVGFTFFKNSFIEGWPLKVAVLTAFCAAGLLIANIFADILWKTRTITSLPLNENLPYIAALVFQGFFLSLTTASGIWLKSIKTK